MLKFLRKVAESIIEIKTLKAKLLVDSYRGS